MNIIEDILILLNAAISGKKANGISAVSEDEWKAILGVCAAQNIHSFVFDALPDDVPSSIFEIWKSIADRTAQLNAQTRNIARAQSKVWTRQGLEFALIKGETVAELYPKPEHRGCGDIDWYFPDDNSWAGALASANKNADNGVSKDSDGDVNYSFNGIIIEHHRDWTQLSSRQKRRIAGKATIENGKLCIEDNLLLLECHILHHLAWKGINLKQFADLAIARKSFDGKYDKTHFSRRMQALGLGKWSKLLDAAIETIFKDGQNGGRDVEALIHIIFTDGCAREGKGPVPSQIIKRIFLLLKYAPSEFFARILWLSFGRIVIHR